MEPSKISRFSPRKIAKFRGPFLKVSPSVCGGKVVSRNEISERASGGIGKGCKGQEGSATTTTTTTMEGRRCRLGAGQANDFLMRQCKPQLLRNGLPCPPISSLKWLCQAARPSCAHQPAETFLANLVTAITEISAQFVLPPPLPVAFSARCARESWNCSSNTI